MDETLIRKTLKTGMAFHHDGVCGWLKFNMDADFNGTQDLSDSLAEIDNMGYSKFAIEICMKHEYMSFTEMQFRFIK